MPFTSLVRRLHAVLGGHAKCCLGMAMCLKPPHGYLQPLQPSLSAPRGAAPGGLPTQLGSYKGRLCGWFRESPAGQHARRQKQEPETVQTPNRLLLAGDMVHEHLHAARHSGHRSCCILCGHGGQGDKCLATLCQARFCCPGHGSARAGGLPQASEDCVERKPKKKRLHSLELRRAAGARCPPHP